MFRRVLLVAAVAAVVAGCNEQQQEVELQTEEQKVSYGMGLNLGARIQEEFALDVDAFALGMRHAVEGGERRMSDEEIAAAVQSFQEKQMAKLEAEFQQQSDANKAQSEEYLAANAAKEGVVTTDSGLQYRVIEQGEGAVPTIDDMVQVHYRGTLVDGTEFDSSYQRGEPVSFPVAGVIPGWTEALQIMPVGSKWELVIPSDLAYGPGGTGGVIGPNAALVFEVELLDIIRADGDNVD
ncbi:MAG: FKBP-type peptidyl-prolyl cis-trans isomerase [Spongiibacteraceae bacterium]|jgi:FKBP-type peptidyl-prolyl cis-trans isomerase|nr:FKBP-type peptidyl-prolyl cis-trans isomerase [Spongiibacteraceae bacterium]